MFDMNIIKCIERGRELLDAVSLRYADTSLSDLSIISKIVQQSVEDDLLH